MTRTLFGVLHRGQLAFILQTDAGIDQTGDAGAFKQFLFAALKAADAVTDIGEMSLLSLHRQERICQRTTGHTDEVSLVHHQQGIRHSRIVDPVGQDNRDMYQFFDLLGTLHIESMLREHGRNDLPQGRAGIHTVGNMDSVEP